MTSPAELRWWIIRQVQLPDGDFDVEAQIEDGRVWRSVIRPSAEAPLDVAIAAGVRAWLAGDRRWTPKSDRGGHA